MGHLFAAWVAFWASIMEIRGPIPVQVTDLGGRQWAEVRIDQYGMPEIRVDYRLSSSEYREKALHEVCHLYLGHHETDLPNSEKEKQVGKCVNLFKAVAR